MTKVHIDKDEWYPVYSVIGDYGKEIDLPDEVIARLKDSEQRFMEVQEELAKYYDAA